MAAATTSPEAQKDLLLAARIHEQVGWNWQVDVPLEEFQGVSVDDAGLVVGLDFSEQEALEFDLVVLAPLTSLQVVNFRNCRKATGECLLVDPKKGKEQVGVVGPDFIYESHQYYTSHYHDTEKY